ncbi:MAG TPA: glycosyltransferase family 87 protein, partial [Candidatus Binataceae bacterium]|nr:glycosyltransferase family 87 protein [Candidatus Binataceae bacterium]
MNSHGVGATDTFIAPRGLVARVIARLRDGDFVTGARVEGYSRLIGIVYLAIFAASIAAGWSPAVSHHVIATDYSKCVAASSLALHGRAAAAYDHQAEERAEREVTGDPDFPFLIWDYPPPFLLFVLPAAMLPYKASLLMWTLITFAGYLLVMRAMAGEYRAWWPILAFPGAMVTVLDGQNGFITLA